MMLNFLEGENIFSVKLSKNKTALIFKEACDGYFRVYLNKAQVVMLIDELSDLASQIKEVK